MLVILACGALEQRLPPQTQSPDARAAKAERDDEPPGDEPVPSLQRALAEVDRSCAHDTDCALVTINTPCAPSCGVHAVSRGSGLELLSRALRAVTESCPVDAGVGPWYGSFYCSANGFEARCRDQRCERVEALCSPACSERGDSCVGAPGVDCQRCPAPEQAHGSCAVLGQRCHYGECASTAECLAGAGSADGGTWDLTVVDCI